jgi:SWI/SNF-related matrix-associated actin-dependent regulator of chromatin subfamily A containing DEAD/H box 1
MSLLCFLMPLFSRKSSDEFDESQGHDGGESMLQYFVSMQKAESNDVEAYKKLKQLFSPFVLRRRKDDVLSQILPPKEQLVEFVELDSVSRVRYNSIIADHVENKKKGSAAAYEHLFTQLRKAAHHPLMLRSRYVSPEEKEHLNNWFYQYGAFRGEGCTKAKVAAELEKYTDFDIHLTASELIDDNPQRRRELGRYILDEQDLFCSAKFVRLQKILPNLIANDHRILLFSSWTTCLDLLGCLLEQMGLGFLRIDGQTAVADRQSLIDQWNQNASIPVFLLSTKACGLGLNLTSADTCIQHDLDFNPFNDLQAEDRCHR